MGGFGFGRLREAFELSRETLGGFGFSIVCRFGKFLEFLGAFGKLWEALGGFAKLWYASEGFAMFGDALEGFGRLWQPL